LVGLIAYLYKLFNGDSSDGFWYNYSEPAGNQLYPTGIHKYYDLYSWNGFNLWIGDRVMWILYRILLPVPLPAILAFFSTDNSDWWKVLVPAWLGRALGLTVENGWLMG
jgi:hypothetical protein